jgi:hypothetical protein
MPERGLSVHGQPPTSPLMRLLMHECSLAATNATYAQTASMSSAIHAWAANTGVRKSRASLQAGGDKSMSSAIHAWAANTGVRKSRASLQAGGDNTLSWPVKVEEGSLLRVLEMAALHGDTELAEETWGLLVRSLAVPNPPQPADRSRQLERAGGCHGRVGAKGGWVPRVGEHCVCARAVEARCAFVCVCVCGMGCGG